MSYPSHEVRTITISEGGNWDGVEVNYKGIRLLRVQREFNTNKLSIIIDVDNFNLWGPIIDRMSKRVSALVTFFNEREKV